MVRVGTIGAYPIPLLSVSVRHPDHSDIEQQTLQAWETYRRANRARVEASAAVDAKLAAARSEGVSMYRMAKWLGVTERAIKVRLEKYDRTHPKP